MSACFAGPGLVDRHGRKVNYLRVSVTDRCNLRCAYCATGDMQFIPHPEILRYEEFLTIIGMARDLGVRKIRLTGGEPFARRDFSGFVRQISDFYPDLDLRVTTNGTLMGKYLEELKDSGLKRINMSLDTLNRETYEEITGRDFFSRVMDNLEAAMDLGFKVKINAVAVRGISDVELPDFLELARTRSVQVRFIELMPMAKCAPFSQERFLPASELLEQARCLVPLEQASRQTTSGPAQVYRIRGGKGSFGVISAISQHFCAVCNRLRITASGGLRTCLYSDREYRLRPILRSTGVSNQAVARVMARANRNKPLGFKLLEAREGAEEVCHTRMSAIGG